VKGNALAGALRVAQRIKMAGMARRIQAMPLLPSRIITLIHAQDECMKLAGLGLLVSGWIIAIAALCLLPEPAFRNVFVVAGLLLECFGLFLAGREHRDFRGGRT
jgi:hypothetical protein